MMEGVSDERSAPVITDNAEQSRYEARIDGELAGFLEYRDRGDRVVLVHTEVDPSFEGRGVGGALAKSAIEGVIAAGKLITPLCPFVVEYLRRHPGYADHVDEAHRAEIQ